MEYQKIDTLFLRDEKNIIIPNRFTNSIFEELQHLKWECTEKVDGTNCRVELTPYLVYKGETRYVEVDMKFKGRTDKAEMPQHLLAKLNQLFDKEKLVEIFKLNDVEKSVPVTIFGEGYGVKIQKGGNYIKNDCGFILFDVRIGNWWLERKSLEEIAQQLNIPIVPIIGYMTIPEACEYVKRGFKSTIAENKDYDAEGLVLKTQHGLLYRNGQRIITKIKTCDFQKYKNVYGDAIVEQKPNPNYKK